MSCEEIFEKLSKNPPQVSQETTRLLIKIAENILKDPSNLKLRTLQKNNQIIASKVLQVAGGKFCLGLMGFVEDKDSFSLPRNAPLNKLKDLIDALQIWRDLDASSSKKLDQKPVDSDKGASSVSKPPVNHKNLSMAQCSNQLENDFSDLRSVKPFVLPPMQQLFTNQFLHGLEVHFHNSLRYGDKDLQARAKKLIPLAELEKEAQKRLRSIQEHYKKNKLGEPNISIQETLLLELLRWFKEDFFSWVDSPDCQFCGEKCYFSHMSNDPQMMVYTTRVELHKCQRCHQFTQFARYNDLNILLETRRGRCGEWANAFTLFCKAMGWDARFVVDEGDHVWTEVYSIAQKRWLHCDSCENVCDKPLIYETGWKKNITYVIAYSEEEVQDVTWRYTANHKATLNKRRKCSEQGLVNAIITLNKSRQEKLSKPRRDYLAKRCLMELAELLNEKKASEDESQGRISGGADWRLARGEIQDEPASDFIWKITTSEIQNTATVRYSAAKDTYEYLVDEKLKKEQKKWNSGAFCYTNVSRKQEKDWKKVYLARKEGSTEATITWKFEIEDHDKTLDRLDINLPWTTFESGQVTAKVCAGDVCMPVDRDSKTLSTTNFAGQLSLSLEVTLEGGKGDVAWQHTQLFRQSTDSNDFPFSIKFYFK